MFQAGMSATDAGSGGSAKVSAAIVGAIICRD
jgi:hypothetical protein